MRVKLADRVRQRSSAGQRARIFSDAKNIDDPWLNRIGVQPFRSVTARLIHRVAARLRRDEIEELERTGIMVCNDFLPPDEFDRLCAEAEEYANARPASGIYQLGTSRLEQWALPPQDPERFPGLTVWSQHPRVIQLATAAEQQTLGPGRGTRVLEHLHLGDYEIPDEQCDLHMDAVFDTHKLWLYLDDVTPDQAPFIYVPTSHKLDGTRIRGDYVESTGNNRGSRRISDGELRRRGLEPVTITCPRNTLVLANTCGYHCRAMGATGAIRRSLHMSFRSNPFEIRRRLRLSGR